MSQITIKGRKMLECNQANRRRSFASYTSYTDDIAKTLGRIDFQYGVLRDRLTLRHVPVHYRDDNDYILTFRMWIDRRIARLSYRPQRGFLVNGKEG